MAVVELLSVKNGIALLYFFAIWEKLRRGILLIALTTTRATTPLIVGGLRSPNRNQTSVSVHIAVRGMSTPLRIRFKERRDVVVVSVSKRPISHGTTRTKSTRRN